MPRVFPSPFLRFSTIAVAVLLSGCESRQSGTETASASPPATAEAAGANTGAVPLTSASEEARRLYLEGRNLGEQLRAHEARERFEQAVAKDPSFAMAHYQLAANAATAKDFFGHMKQAVALSEKASEGERLTIRALEAGGNADPKKQQDILLELVARYPNDERAHFQLGVTYFGAQKFDQAIEEYRKATEINPGFSPAYNLLGYSYRQVEKYGDAETAFKKYIELIPGDPNPYDSYAELLMRMGRFDESIAQYEKALSVDEHFTPSRVGIATNLMYQGKPDEAAARMDELYGRARDDADRRTALFVKGVILADAQRTDAAVKEIEREYALDVKLADTANMSGDALLIGNMLLDAGRTEQAAKQFRLALDLVEKSTLSDAVKQDTRLADHYNRGRVALAKGDIAKAKNEAKAYADGAAARQNNARVRQAHEFEGQIALAEKRYDEAIAQFGQANQQDPRVLFWTSQAYEWKGDAAKAKELAARAANANVLPLASYAFIREKARKM